MTHFGKIDRMVSQRRAYNRFVMFIIAWIAISAIGALGTIFVLFHFLVKFW